MSGEKNPWQANITEDGDLHSVFVEGHVPLDGFPDAAEQIVAAFAEFGPDMGELVSEHFDGEPVHKMLQHFWLRPKETPDGEQWFFAKEGEAGAVPVTGMRLL